MIEVVRPIAILKCGQTIAPVRERWGDFEEYIARGAGIERASLRVIDATKGDELPEPSELAGVIGTGSSAMVSAREPWSERAAAWVARLVDAGTPFLGICYGHQLLAHALGGRVGKNPRGREIGTIDVVLDAAGDELFDGLPSTIVVQATHVEAVLEVPSGARVLAQNALDPVQAFVVGSAWGVQFHPELDAPAIREYIASRVDALTREGLDADALRARARDSDHGARILTRFAAIATAV